MKLEKRKVMLGVSASKFKSKIILEILPNIKIGGREKNKQKNKSKAKNVLCRKTFICKKNLISIASIFSTVVKLKQI